MEFSSKTLLDLSPHKLIARHLAEALTFLGVGSPNSLEIEYAVAETPDPSYGDYGVAVARFARKYRVDLSKLVERAKAGLSAERIVRSVEFVRGYLNVGFDAGEVARLLFGALEAEGESFGIVKTDKPMRIVVEHTSANPVHPLHIGHARNASLGDTLSRLLRARGHAVQTRFYINDLGRQAAVMAYGVLALGGEVPGDVKPDHWIGAVYAITHTLADIQQAKREAEEARKRGDEEAYRDAVRRLDSLVADAARLRERYPELFDRLAEKLKDKDIEAEISRLMRAYEYREDETLAKRIRGIVEKCLEGFRQTLERINVSFDVWDWESDLAWSGMVAEILEKAKQTPYYTLHRGAAALNLKPLLKDPIVRSSLGLPEDYDIPPLILQRSDGTTLYTTRDIAYALKKFREFNADKVYNVIAAEQRLEQLQVRLALIALGYRREGLNMHHYAYEMVNLPGEKMSGRRGRYVTLDELLDRAVQRALEEVEKRSPHLPPEEKRRIAERVGTAAVRYTLVSVSALKPMTFSIEEALNFEKNTAPYLLYTYARASNILAKARERGLLNYSLDDIDYTAAEATAHRRKLIMHLYLYPYYFTKAADELKPEILVAYLGKLADAFNTWYSQQDSAINEPQPQVRAFKLEMVKAVKQVVGSALRLLGIEPIERM
jgi:arginyl-tRNA synthetase